VQSACGFRLNVRFSLKEFNPNRREMMMADRTVWGFVSPEGNILSGTGFLVDRSNTGLYSILFEHPFNVVPAVVATQVYPNDVSSQGGDTRDNAVIVGIATHRVRVKTGNGEGKADNRYFTFIATGI
jgi:hypothetical protein